MHSVKANRRLVPVSELSALHLLHEKTLNASEYLENTSYIVFNICTVAMSPFDTPKSYYKLDLPR